MVVLGLEFGERRQLVCREGRRQKVCSSLKLDGSKISQLWKEILARCRRKTGHQTDGCSIVAIQGGRAAQREPQGQWAEGRILSL